MPPPWAVATALTDAELDSRLLRLARGERQVLVVFLVHLAEFERRRAHEDRSYPSAFVYCTKRLGLSEAESFLRIRAARLARQYPEVLDMLACGGLQLSGLARLSPHINAGNAAQLLASARGKTRREVERLALTFEHGAPKADVVRALPPPDAACSAERRKADSDPYRRGGPQPLELLAAERPAAAGSRTTGAESPTPAAAGRMPAAEIPTPAPGAPAPAAGDRTPEAGSRGERWVRISFTAPESLLAGIERAKALLRHKHPTGRLEHVIGEAIEALLDARDPQRRLARRAARRRTAQRTDAQAARRSRRVPQGVRDAVLSRDGWRCSFVAADGQRCEAVARLEYDHVRPWALGGRSDDPANIRILCRAHNQRAARRIFGPRGP